MFKKSIISFIIFLFYFVCCFFIYQNHNSTISKIGTSKNNHFFNSDSIENNEELEEAIAILEIPKIDLQQKIYSFKDIRNNVDENVMILEKSILPDQENSIVFLAAHSGTGEKAIFTRLDELQVGDSLFFIFQNQRLTYQIKFIEEQQKNGTITVPKNSTDELILTTCSEKNMVKQLVIIADIIKK